MEGLSPVRCLDPDETVLAAPRGEKKAVRGRQAAYWLLSGFAPQLPSLLVGTDIQTKPRGSWPTVRGVVGWRTAFSSPLALKSCAFLSSS